MRPKFRGSIVIASSSSFVDPARFLDDLKNPGLVSVVDLLRWLAAVEVVIGHARFALLKGYGLLTPAETPLWVKGWYFVTGYFVEAVLVFFVLSGFLVGGMACARLSRRQFDPASYAVDRFSRLYTAFLPALLLTVLVTAIGTHWFGATGLYDGTNPTFAQKDTAIVFAANTGWTVFAGNAAMLQFYLVEPYGSNPPLWTLSSEFWFYVVFGLAATAGMVRGLKRYAACGAALVAAVALGPMFWLYLGMWLIGVVAAVLRPPRLPLAAVALVLLAAILLFRRYADAQLAPTDAVRFGIQYGICLATGMLLLGLRGRELRWAHPLARVNKTIADFSYSLYLIHFPLLILLIAALGKLTGNPGFVGGFAPTDPIALASYAAELILAFGGAWLFAQATERQTWKVRAWLKRQLVARPRPELPPELPEPDRGHSGLE